jgi:hypothetical protein
MESTSTFPRAKQWFSVERTGNKVKICVRKQSGNVRIELSYRQAQTLADALIAKLRSKPVVDAEAEDLCWRDPEIM